MNFAALVSVVHDRAEVEEIAQRLRTASMILFTVGGYLLSGKLQAFGIALYPENGNTRDSLLSAADAAMYIEKNKKNEKREKSDFAG